MNHATHIISYRPDIDGLRALAILPVVLFHAFPALMPGGFVGVDIFFVISGYLISTIIFKSLRKGGFSFSEFYIRRAKRILPPLVFMIVIVLIVGWSVLLPVEYAELGKHAMAGLGFVANIVLWLETGYFDNAAELKPLLHLWSLGVEEQFYIFWPLIVLVAWRMGLSLIKVIGFLVLLSFGLNIFLTYSAPDSAYFLLPARAWELLVGAALAWLNLQGHSLGVRGERARNVVSVLGLGILVASVLLISKTSLFPGWWALMPTIGATLLIAAGPDAFINKRLLSNRLLVFIGLISFPLYLWHWPLLTFARILHGETVSAEYLVGALLFAFVLSWLSYAFIETPFRQTQRRAPLVGLICFGLIVALGSHNIYSRDGLNFRIKDAQAKAEAQALEWPPHLRSGADCKPAGLESISLGCQLMRPDQPANAVIIGDSHANHYYWVLETAFKDSETNLMQLTKGGCPPLVGLKFLNGGVVVPCNDSMDPIVDHVIHNDDIRTVFVAGRWMAYMTGRDIDDPADHVSDETIFIGEPGPNDSNQRMNTFLAALNSTLERLTASGKRIVFLHAVPELPFNARECISWTPNQFVSRIPRESCSFDNEITRARSSEYRPALDSLLQQFPEVIQVDPGEMFCDSEDCRIRQDGVLLYRDDDHLSIDGASWLGFKLQQTFKSALDTL